MQIIRIRGLGLEAGEPCDGVVEGGKKVVFGGGFKEPIEVGPIADWEQFQGEEELKSCLPLLWIGVPVGLGDVG